MKSCIINQNCTHFDNMIRANWTKYWGWSKDLFVSLQQTFNATNSKFPTFFHSIFPVQFFCCWIGFPFIYSSNERNQLSAKFTTTCTAYWRGRITSLVMRWNGSWGIVLFCPSRYAKVLGERNRKKRGKERAREMERKKNKLQKEYHTKYTLRFM